MSKGVWADASLAKRSAAARKAAATRKKRAATLTPEQRRVRGERAAQRRYLAGKGPPLPAPEPGGAADRVMTADVTIEFTPPVPIRASTGVSISFSTTGCYTKTASATATISALAKQ